MQTQRHFVVQVEDVVHGQRLIGTFCEDFQLDANPFTKLAHTTINIFQPSQATCLRARSLYGQGVLTQATAKKAASQQLCVTIPMITVWAMVAGCLLTVI